MSGTTLIAIEQVASEPAFRHRFLEIHIGHGDHANIHGDGLGAADAVDFLLLQDAQQFGLKGQTHFADLIQQQGPFLGQLEFAGLSRERAGKGPFFMTEQLALCQGFRQGRAVDGHERAVATAAVPMDETGQHLLAGAAFTLDEHRCPAVRNAFGQCQHAEHPRVSGDQGFVSPTVLTLRFTGSPPALPPGVPDGFFDGRGKGFGREGLQQIIGRAGLHGLHGMVDRAVGRGHDHRCVGAQLSDLGQDLQPGRFRQFGTGDDHAEAAESEFFNGLLPIFGPFHGITALGQGTGHHGSDVRCVIDDQYGVGSHGMAHS